MSQTVTPIPFTHLHTHSPEGSLLDGYMRIDKAIELAKSWGMDSLGISDHGTMAAHIKFNQLCKENEIHPVFGMEAYVTKNKSFKKSDFDAIKYTEKLDDENNITYVFAFKSLKEIEESSEWVLVDSIKPKSESNKIKTAAKKHFLSENVQKLKNTESLKGFKTPALNKMALEEYKALEEKGLFACIHGDTRNQDFWNWYPRIGHLLLIAKNDEGYRNLLQLNNIGQIEGFYGKPRVDYDDLKKFGKGIVATSACLGSISSQLINRGRLKEAKEHILFLNDCFDEFFLEVQPSKQPEQWVVNNQLFEWSKELNIPLIATSDVHMVFKSDLKVHAAFTNIGIGNDKDSQDNDISVYDSCYFMHPQEMLDGDIPQEALQNAYDLSHRCHVTILDNKVWKFPEYEVPKGFDFDSYLRHLTYNGFMDLFLEEELDTEVYQERIEYELEIIKNKNLSAYFVIVWDYIHFAHKNGILVGAGRGSGAGSLVLYCLKVVNINPIENGLLFERMLNPERDSLPDIDTDFDYLRRHEVIEYLQSKYGSDKVAQIGTYQTMSSKAILKNIGKVLGIDYDYINDLTSKIPSHQGKVMLLEQAMEEIAEIKQASEKYPEFFKLALETESLPKSSGVHPCGVEIVANSLLNELPLMRGGDDSAVTQYEGPVLEDLGYVKFDILGLKNLSVVDISARLVKERHGVDINPTKLKTTDPNVFNMIREGDTLGLFQIELEMAPLGL